MPEEGLVQVTDKSIEPLFRRALSHVREDVLDNPYIQEALRVLPVGGYRSAIGSFWNAVVDDLRNKIIHRSLSLFNKTVNIGRDIKTYEDFQNYVTDDQLIEGAYKIGVIGWEASKVLKHSKETRHIFDGHPKSTEPSVIKVLAMFDDCVKYVLNEPYPPQIIDIDEYIEQMKAPDYDRNEIAIANAITELPELYKTELINRLFTSYIHEYAPSDLRSNIEFAAPILWRVLPKPLKIQVIHRVDQEITRGSSVRTSQAFAFVKLVGGTSYLTPTARTYILKPLIDRLKSNLDNWAVENECVLSLEPYAANVPADLLQDYVSALTHTYIGHTGGSAFYSRTDFYANRAAPVIPKMFEVFDDAACEAFIECVRTSRILWRRIESPAKLNRLRSLANIVLQRISAKFPDRTFLEVLVNADQEPEFFKLLGLG
jgi:hypothetical protein